MSSVNRHPEGRFPTRPPRVFTPDDSIAVAAGEDSSRHGGEVAVATIVGEGLDNSLVDSSDEEVDEEVVSVHLS